MKLTDMQAEVEAILSLIHLRSDEKTGLEAIFGKTKATTQLSALMEQQILEGRIDELTKLVKLNNIEILRVKRPIIWGADTYDSEIAAVPRFRIDERIQTLKKVLGKNDESGGGEASPHTRRSK